MPKELVAAIKEPTLIPQASRDYDCVHCGRSQVVQPQGGNFGGAKIVLWQCLSCSELLVVLQHMKAPTDSINPHRANRGSPLRIYPPVRARPPRHFDYVPAEILTSYRDACGLFSAHAGAAGAYTRRSLELLLDGMGYQAKTILDSIKLAREEPDYDRRLPKRYLERLDYIKEVGNFALHVRRDHELAIIEVDTEQVDVCLDIVEALFDYVFEEPGQQYAKTVEINASLKEAGKKELTLPEAPGWLWNEAAAHSNLPKDTTGETKNED